MKTKASSKISDHTSYMGGNPTKGTLSDILKILSD